MLREWADYFVAMSGAAAALTGLIFVGLSISLNKILTIPRLVSRALQALTLLGNNLIISSLCLVPAQGLTALGAEVLFISGLVWALTLYLYLDIAMIKSTEKPYKNRSYVLILISQLAIVPFIIGAVIVLRNNPTGIYWFVPAIIFCFTKSILDAWVLLIEINR